VLDDSIIIPLRPTREALHGLRDREATARLELEHCRHDRPADAVTQAAMHGARIRERLVQQQEEERAA
jgi:hypothetical protein